MRVPRPDTLPVGGDSWTYLSPGQILLGDIYGKLLLLSLQKSSGVESVEMAVRDLGDVSLACAQTGYSAAVGTSRALTDLSEAHVRPPRRQPWSLCRLRPTPPRKAAPPPAAATSCTSRPASATLSSSGLRTSPRPDRRTCSSSRVTRAWRLSSIAASSRTRPVPLCVPYWSCQGTLSRN